MQPLRQPALPNSAGVPWHRPPEDSDPPAYLCSSCRQPPDPNHRPVHDPSAVAPCSELASSRDRSPERIARAYLPGMKDRGSAQKRLDSWEEQMVAAKVAPNSVAPTPCRLIPTANTNASTADIA